MVIYPSNGLLGPGGGLLADLGTLFGPATARSLFAVRALFHITAGVLRWRFVPIPLPLDGVQFNEEVLERDPRAQPADVGWVR